MVGQVDAVTDGGEELGDVRGVEPPPQQIADDCQLIQVMIAVEGQPSVTARRIEQTAFAVRPNVADADSRRFGERPQPVLSHPKAHSKGWSELSRRAVQNTA